jgi:hypothetical protein
MPSGTNKFDVEIIEQDARVTAVKEFLARYKSALTPFAGEIVAKADKYGIDYRLIPAIAMQESTLCKNAPKNSHNCWGFGMYNRKVLRFDSFPDAIDTVSKTLATKYIAIGLETPEQIMSKYNPVSKGTWAIGVAGYMERLDFNL